MTLRRITLAAALALVPASRAADVNLEDWLHDNLSNRALWLYGSNNLAFETAPTELPPRTPGKRWVLNRDGQSAAVVYFVPGDIRSVEVDTHRKPGAAGDFTLSVSPDGKLWRPLAAVAAPLEDGAGWEFRLLAADAVPAHQMHLRVEFPAGAKLDTHRLTEVWIRYTWDAALLNPDAANAHPAAQAATPAAPATKIPETAGPAGGAETAVVDPAAVETPAVPAATAPAATRDAIVVFGKPAPAESAPNETFALPLPSAPEATVSVETATAAPRTAPTAAPVEPTVLAPPTPAAIRAAEAAGAIPERPVVAAPSAVDSTAASVSADAPPAAPLPVSTEVAVAPAADTTRSRAVEATQSASREDVRRAVKAKPAKKKLPQRSRIGPRSR